jgi:hypothetical protein
LLRGTEERLLADGKRQLKKRLQQMKPEGNL